MSLTKNALLIVFSVSNYLYNFMIVWLILLKAFQFQIVKQDLASRHELCRQAENIAKQVHKILEKRLKNIKHIGRRGKIVSVWNKKPKPP